MQYYEVAASVVANPAISGIAVYGCGFRANYWILGCVINCTERRFPRKFSTNVENCLGFRCPQSITLPLGMQYLLYSFYPQIASILAIFLKKPKGFDLPADKHNLGRQYLPSGRLRLFSVWISPDKWHYQEGECRLDRFHQVNAVFHRVVHMSACTLSTSYPQWWITRLTLDLYID